MENLERIQRTYVQDPKTDKSGKPEGLLTIGRVKVPKGALTLHVAPKCGAFVATGLRLLCDRQHFTIAAITIGVQDLLGKGRTLVVHEGTRGEEMILADAATGADARLIAHEILFTEAVMVTSICPIMIRLEQSDAEPQMFAAVFVGRWERI